MGQNGWTGLRPAVPPSRSHMGLWSWRRSNSEAKVSWLSYGDNRRPNGKGMKNNIGVLFFFVFFFFGGGFKLGFFFFFFGGGLICLKNFGRVYYVHIMYDTNDTLK